MATLPKKFPARMSSLAICGRRNRKEAMASYSEIDPAATQYERLVFALAELQARGRAARADALAAGRMRDPKT
jgi:hypothetical protein